MDAALHNAGPAPSMSTALRCALAACWSAKPPENKSPPLKDWAATRALHKVQEAWIANDVPQCGYCQSGMIMAVAALLKDKPKPTDKDIDEAITNICRCGTFQQAREAIHAAANA